MQTYENIPFEKSFGTIIAERAIDLIMLFITIGLALTLESDLIYNLLAEKAIDPWRVIASLCVGGGLFYILFQRLKKTEHPLAKKITSLVDGLSEGFFTIVHMERNGHTSFIHSLFGLCILPCFT